MEIKMIACLGNPGRKYEYNRHNAGFLFGAYLLNVCSLSAGKRECQSVTHRGVLGGQEILVLFPQGYVNRSGEAVADAARFYKIPVEDIIAVHDELELEYGEIRVKKGGGHKGHNGIRSITSALGSPEFYRIRFGIGRPKNDNQPVADHVLSDFSREEQERLDDLFAAVYNELEKIVVK